MFDIEIVARAIVFETTETMKISVKLHDSLAASARVKPVNILSDEQKVRVAFFDFDQGQMSGIRFCFECLFAPPRVPLLNEFRISPECFGGRDLFRFKFAPKTSLSVAEGGEPAFGGNSSSSEDDNFRRVAQRSDERRSKIHHKLAPEVGFGAVFPCILLH